MYDMERVFAILFLFLSVGGAFAAPVGRASRYVNPQSYTYMYPYLNNQMRTELNPGTTVSATNNPIDVIVRTTPMSEPRRVVPRSSKSSTTARVATAPAPQNTARRVVQRPTNAPVTQTNNAATRSAGRLESNALVRTEEITTTVDITSIGGGSSSRCMADYINCMNMYCMRENTAYNRCYCSARLSQIDAEYQPQLENMVTQILKFQNTGEWSDEEMNEYWMDKIGKYIGENSWIKLDEALNITWPSPDERARGNAAFMTGHEYCVAHLRSCGYMAQNLRDAYRSQISRDCKKYENSLMLLRNAAASMLEHYSN